MKKIKSVENILADGFGKVEQWDFSDTNYNHNTRVEAVSTVASVCFGKDSAKKPEALYDRLLRESMSLPSSSFEFVPVLISDYRYENIKQYLDDNTMFMSFLKYSKLLDVDGKRYFLTNLRNCINHLPEDVVKDLLNQSEEEIQIIKDNFFVFKIEMDLVTARQWVRHRIGNYNEKSRRYTKDKPSIYLPESLTSSKEVVDLVNKVVDTYEELKTKVSAQEARYILPLGMMTTIWVGGNKDYWRNFLDLRLDKHAQPEIRKFAKVVNEMIGDKV